jgi:hypothetical protein
VPLARADADLDLLGLHPSACRERGRGLLTAHARGMAGVYQEESRQPKLDARGQIQRCDAARASGCGARAAARAGHRQPSPLALA